MKKMPLIRENPGSATAYNTMFMLTKRKLCTKEKLLRDIQTQDFTLLKEEQTADNCKTYNPFVVVKLPAIPKVSTDRKK